MEGVHREEYAAGAYERLQAALVTGVNDAFYLVPDVEGQLRGYAVENPARFKISVRELRFSSCTKHSIIECNPSELGFDGDDTAATQTARNNMVMELQKQLRCPVIDVCLGP